MKQFEFEIPVDTDARIRETTAEVLKDPRIKKMLERTPGLRKHIEANPYIMGLPECSERVHGNHRDDRFFSQQHPAAVPLAGPGREYGCP